MAVVQLTRSPDLVTLAGDYPFITRTEWEILQKERDVRERSIRYEGLIQDPARAMHILVGGLAFVGENAAYLLLVRRLGPLLGPGSAALYKLTHVALQDPTTRAILSKLLLYSGKSAFQYWLSGYAHRTATRVVTGQARHVIPQFKSLGKTNAKRMADAVVKFTNNPLGRSVAQSSQAYARAYRLDNYAIYPFVDFMEWMLQELPDRAMRKIADFLLDRSEDMPYNRRTGQWYPTRRRYGYGNRGGYRRGGYSRGYTPRRRSYRRW